MPPPAVCPPGTFNTWKGFPGELYALRTQKPADERSPGVLAFLHHVDTLFGSDAPTVKYVLDWIAQIVQEPGKKRGTALVLKGEQGVGKNRLTDLIKLILGEGHVMETSRPRDSLFSRFTSQLENMLLVVVNEATGKDSIAHSEPLKDMITNSAFRCEAKNMDAYMARSYDRYIFTTNNDNVVKVSPHDRRFVVLEVQPTLRGNTAYFKELSRHMEDPHAQYEFFCFLEKRDIADVDWINDRPMTQYRRDMIEINLPLEHVFLRDDVILGAEREVVTIGATDLYTDYTIWLRRHHKSRNYMNFWHFGQVMTSLATGTSRMPGMNKARRGRGFCYIFNVPVVRAAMVSANWIAASDLPAPRG